MAKSKPKSPSIGPEMFEDAPMARTTPVNGFSEEGRWLVRVVDVSVYYLEMHAPSGRVIPPPREGLSVLHARKPTVAYYRFLYDTVGKDYNWYGRARLTDAELAAVLDDPLNEVHALHADGTPAGFAELDRRNGADIELVQFGLMPGFIGRGLGRYFLRRVIDTAWSYRPRRLWLHTCTLDHPAALPNYTKAGFTVYKEERITREMPG